jgi:hypothetical protein
MFTFREFILKESADDLTVVPVSEEVVSSFEEINQLLDNVLTENTLNPYIGWINASKVMSNYGIQLPRSIFKDLQEGEEIVALSINESEYYFYYEYQMNEHGSYQSFATITDEQGLEELIKEE